MLSSAKRKLSEFFFAKEIPCGVAVVRILLPLVLAFVMLQRWPYSRELYSTDGAPMQLSVGYGYGNLMPELSGGVVVALHTALIFFLLCSSIGWCSQFSLGISAILYIYFNMLDYTSSMTKYSVIASHGLIILAMSPCGYLWSVDEKLRRKKAGGDLTTLQTEHPVWAGRLLQLMLGYIYLGAAITKLHTPAFFSGLQLKYWLLTEVNHSQPAGDLLSQFPAVLSLMAYLTLVWEVCFLFLAWKGAGRAIILGMGVLFHLGTAVLLGLYVFPMVCISLYFCFFNERDAAKISLLLQRRRERRGLSANSVSRTRRWSPQFLQRLRFPSPAVFAFATVSIMLLGVQTERWHDPYGLRRSEGPYALKPIPTEEVQRMLAADGAPMRIQDRFFSFEVGTTLVSGVIANRQTVFHQGETMLAQCALNPPHEDMWIECCLLDGQGQELNRMPQVATREMMLGNFAYHLDDSLAPGQYELVLSSTGQEVYRRTVTILPRKRVDSNSTTRMLAN